jgi:hypothetical protein
VAPFDPDADLAGDRAYQLLKNGFVTRYRSPESLADTVAWLTAHGYRTHRLDGSNWTTQADFHRDVREALGFPGHYGNNLDAFNDSLRDLARHDRGDTGTVLVFTGYDAFAAREPRAARVILDIVADQARTALLFGHRVLCLVESDVLQ